MRERMGDHSPEFSEKIEETPSVLDRVVDTGFTGRIARKHGVPDIRDLGANPNIFSAASRVKFENLPENTWPEGFGGKLIERAARLETVLQNCKLTKPQTEFVQGLKDTFLGTALFMSEFPQKVKEFFPTKGKIVQKLATADIILTMATACTPRNSTITPELTMPPQSPATETAEATSVVTSIPGFIPKETASVGDPIITETPAPGSTSTSESNLASTETATATAEAPIIEVAPYPSSITEFEKGPTVLKGVDAEERIKALGAGEDLLALRDWYVAAGVPTSMQEVVIGENEMGAHWNIMIKYSDGSYGIITLTSGTEAGKIVRDGGLVSYLYSEERPTFSYKKLENPDGYENFSQDVAMSKSLWFAFSVEQGDQLFGWENLDRGPDGEWVDLRVLATPTPEGPMGTFTSFEGVTHTENGYQITVGDTGRLIEVTEENAEKQIYFDKEMSLYKIFDEKGNITAEYDPGQGVEGDADYVPATGWVDIQKLATDLICKENIKCHVDNQSEDDVPIPDNLLIEMTSTGVFRKIEAKDVKTDKIIGEFLISQMVTKKNGVKTATYWVLFQGESSSDPGVNSFPYGVANIKYRVSGKRVTGQEGLLLYSLQEWMTWIPKGSSWNLFFSKSGYTYQTYFDMVKASQIMGEKNKKITLDFFDSSETNTKEEPILVPLASSPR